MSSAIYTNFTVTAEVSKTFSRLLGQMTATESA